jgi:prevent-host-death family protein
VLDVRQALALMLVDAFASSRQGARSSLEFDITAPRNHNDHMTRTVGAREFKTRLGTYLRRVQRGATLVVTERGRPVAEVRPIALVEDEERRLSELVALGVLTRTAEAPMRSFKPIRVKGRRVSEVLIEDREDRV